MARFGSQSHRKEKNNFLPVLIRSLENVKLKFGFDFKRSYFYYFLCKIYLLYLMCIGPCIVLIFE